MNAAGDVHSVRFFVVEADPSFDIAQNLKGVVAELISAVIILAHASELWESVGARQHWKGASTYSGDKGVDVSSNFRMDNVRVAVGHLHPGPVLSSGMFLLYVATT